MACASRCAAVRDEAELTRVGAMVWSERERLRNRFPGRMLRVMAEELRVYSEQTLWLLNQFTTNVRECPADLLTSRPQKNDGNTLLVIAKHATSVTRAYVLGLACGVPVTRDREREFIVAAEERAAVIRSLETTAVEVREALAGLEPSHLGMPFVPDKSLYGLGEPRKMTSREAIVENIRHLGIHLGELRLTRSLLDSP